MNTQAMPITNTTVYDEKALNALFVLTQRKAIVWSLFLILALIYLFIDGLINRYDNYIIFTAIFGFLFVVMIGQLIMRFISKFRLLNNKNINKIILKYRFEATEFILQFNDQTQDSLPKMSYQSLYKLVVKTDYLFIYTNKHHAMIVDKKGFDHPEHADLIVRTIVRTGVKVRYS